jgi:hypothetical protein
MSVNDEHGGAGMVLALPFRLVYQESLPIGASAAFARTNLEGVGLLAFYTLLGICFYFV